MNWKQHLFTALVSCLLGGGIATLVTLNSTRIAANATAESAEITTIVQRVDAYEKIIADLNARAVVYMDKANVYMEENEELKWELVELREKCKALESKIVKLEKNMAVYEAY